MPHMPHMPHSQFFYVGPPKDGIFLTTIYGLYFSHHLQITLQITILHVGPLWAASMYCINTHPFQVDLTEEVQWHESPRKGKKLTKKNILTVISRQAILKLADI